MAVLSYARLGKMRLNAARLNYCQPWIKVLINGTVRTNNSRMAAMSITQIRNHELDTLRLRVDGFTPTKGHEIKVYMGDTDLVHQLFGGHILNVNTTHETEKTNSVAYDLDCVDYTWLLNRRKVTKKYTSTSASTIAADLMASFSSGFTTTNVVSGLATIDEITFTNEDLSDALTRLSERIGGYWYIDYAKDLHFFTTEDDMPAGSVTDASTRTANQIAHGIDLSQTATRILGVGGGSVSLSDVDAGTTTLPVQESGWYSGSGGTVQCGPQRLTYTGVAAGSETGSTTGYVAAPSNVGTLSINNSGGGSLTTGATYGVGMTYVTDEGETTSCAMQSIVVTGSTPSIVCGSLPTVPSDPKITDRNVYVTDPNGSQLKLRSAGIGLVVTQTEIFSHAGLGANAPTSNSAGFSQATTAAGATSIPVEDLSQFPSSGWAEVGGQVFRYTGRSASSGAGTLTGIPASGTGSLSAPVRAGTVKAVPHLTGIPASSTGSIQYAIKKGDQVDVFVERNDTTAQTNMAGFVGGDGIHEGFIQNGTWGLTELTARADALLTERKNPIETVTFHTRDQTVQTGRTVTFSLSSPAISGTFKIQRVTLTQFDAHAPAGAVLFPTRDVEASSRHFSFEDLVRRIRGVQ